LPKTFDWNCALSTLNTIMMFGIRRWRWCRSPSAIGPPARSWRRCAGSWCSSQPPALASVPEEAGAALALPSAKPNAVYLGKLFFNLALLFRPVVAPVLHFPTPDLQPAAVLHRGRPGRSGCRRDYARGGISGAVKGACSQSELSHPPSPLMLLVMASDSVLLADQGTGIAHPVQGLVAYTVVMITASILLFKFVWKE
jgi:hypothetical protein